MTISARLWLSAAVSLVALLVFSVTLIVELRIARDADISRANARETMAGANAELSLLKDVETGARGYLLTGNPRYLEPLQNARRQLPAAEQRLNDATRDADPATKREVAQLHRFVATKNADVDRLIATQRRFVVQDPASLRMLDEGKSDMDAARAVTGTIVDRTRGRLKILSEALQSTRDRLLAITLGGAGFVGFVVVLATTVSMKAYNTRLRRLQRMLNEMGTVRGAPPALVEADEADFSEVAAAFNDMAIRLSSEEVRRDEAERNLNALNETLTDKALELENYSQTVNIVRRMADRLPSCTDETEFSGVIRSFAPMLTPGRAGALYLLNDARNLLRVGATWNGPSSSLEEFTPEDCWALRRGREHVSGRAQVDVLCPHIVQSEGKTHWCMPLVAQSETVGLLYLEGLPENVYQDHSGGEDVTHMLRETVALGLVNLRLREKLRAQSVRDPLTGLYNRRYLDESLELEIARAIRSDAPIAAIMLDIDFFKSFNDTFGHEAGDLVLKQVADILARSMRKGDIAGRFGGEEFLLLMPGADLDRALARAEVMRKTIATLDIGFAGQKLGRITASFGVAIFPVDGELPGALVQAADKALYAAKAAGRDRVTAASVAPVVARS